MASEKGNELWCIGSNSNGAFALGNEQTLKRLTKAYWTVNKQINKLITTPYKNKYMIYQSKYGDFYLSYSIKYGDHKPKNIAECEYFKENKITNIQQYFIVEDGFIAVSSSQTMYIYNRFAGEGKWYSRTFYEDTYFNDNNFRIQQIVGNCFVGFVLCRNGSVYSKGDTEVIGMKHGLNGQETDEEIKQWTLIPALRNVKCKKICRNVGSSIFLSRKGNVWIVGANAKMEGLGLGHKENVKKPTKITYFEKNDIFITDIAAGCCHVLALDKRGSVYAFGNNEWAQCGDGTKRNLLIPKKMFSKEKIVFISCGLFHSLLRSAENKYYLFGNNGNDQCCVNLDSKKKQSKKKKKKKNKVLTPFCVNKVIKNIVKTEQKILSMEVCGDNTFILMGYEEDERVVFGFIREARNQLLPLNGYYDIPIEIQNMCLSYCISLH
eukprot:394558_1